MTCTTPHLLGPLEVNLKNLLIDVVVSVGCQVCDVSTCSGGDHHAVLNEGVLIHNTVNVSAGHTVTDLQDAPQYQSEAKLARPTNMNGLLSHTHTHTHTETVAGGFLSSFLELGTLVQFVSACTNTSCSLQHCRRAASNDLSNTAGPSWGSSNLLGPARLERDVIADAIETFCTTSSRSFAVFERCSSNA